MEIIKFVTIVVMILLIFYIANSQEKKEKKELKKMQESIKENDKIVTYSGISGIVETVEQDRVILKVYPDMIKISVEKWAIAGIDERENKQFIQEENIK